MIWCAAEHTPLGGLAYRAIVGPAIALASSISAPVGFQIKIIKLRRRASYSNRSLKKKKIRADRVLPRSNRTKTNLKFFVPRKNPERSARPEYAPLPRSTVFLENPSAFPGKPAVPPPRPLFYERNRVKRKGVWIRELARRAFPRK